MSQPAKTSDSNAPTKRPVGDVTAYWNENLRLIGVLLAIWFAVSYVPVFIVSFLNQLIPNFLTGFPFGYYMGSQGSLIVFVVLIFYYSWRMTKMDQKYGLDDD